VRRRRLVALLALIVVLIGAFATVAVVQSHRALPAAKLATTVAHTVRIPGEAVSLPWPSQGTAQLMVDGLGLLGSSKASKSAPIGSVAKVMTAYLVLKDHPLPEGEDGPVITVSPADVADYHARIAGGQSLVAVTAGETLTERDALEALMLPSANNIAHLLGEWDAGTADAFVTKMNATAASLGLTGSHYTDPSGFLPTTTSTPADQVILARAALKLPSFSTIVALRSAKIPVAGTVQNYNGLLGVHGIFGIKTGSTDQAGGNLVFAAHLSVGQTTLTVVGAVFSQPGADTAAQLARVGTVVRKLMTAVEKVVKAYTVLDTRPVGQIATAWGDTIKVRPDANLKVIGWPGRTVTLTTTAAAPGTAVTQGQAVGAVTASGVRVQLRADAASTEPSFWWKLKRKP
jgi:D-alanyl-D-alanine carboxypeptidase (penicillin-binding protein 5/6)